MKQTNIGIKKIHTGGPNESNRRYRKQSTHLWVPDFWQRSEIYKMEKYSTNGADITGYQHAEQCKYIHIYHHAQNLSPNVWKTSTWNLAHRISKKRKWKVHLTQWTLFFWKYMSLLSPFITFYFSTSSWFYPQCGFLFK